MPISDRRRRFTPQRGFTYLLVLVMVAIIGYGLARAGLWWQTEAQRNREAELLFVGDQYRRAIERFLAAQGNTPSFPRTLDDLLLDPRFADTRRYLRKRWPDPISPATEWGLIIDPETRGIAGIYSQAPGRPFKQGGFKTEYDFFKDSDSYGDWKFFIEPPDKDDDADTSTPPPGGDDAPIGGLQPPPLPEPLPEAP